MADELNTMIFTMIGEWYANSENYSLEFVNRFLEKYEGLLISFGLFIRGIRATDENLGPRHDRHDCVLDQRDVNIVPYHNRLDGVLGIISMNITKFEQRYGQPQLQ